LKIKAELDIHMILMRAKIRLKTGTSVISLFNRLKPEETKSKEKNGYEMLNRCFACFPRCCLWWSKKFSILNAQMGERESHATHYMQKMLRFIILPSPLSLSRFTQQYPDEIHMHSLRDHRQIVQ
jgi:hypothetical protein